VTRQGVTSRRSPGPTREDVQACVVTPSGSVLARVPGEPTDAAWDVIAEVLIP